jgi:hypothetical protein
MITWAERAKAATTKMGQYVAAKTDEIPGVRLSSVSAVTSPTFLEKHDIATAVDEDPNRWCWSRSSAMNGAEIPGLRALAITARQGKMVLIRCRAQPQEHARRPPRPGPGAQGQDSGTGSG